MKDLLTRIQELETLAEKATSGPWEYIPEDDVDDWQLISRANDDAVWIKQDDSGVPIPHEDGEFIAASRTAIPELCSVIREMVEVLTMGAFHHNVCPWLDGKECLCAHRKVDGLLQKYGISSDNSPAGNEVKG